MDTRENEEQSKMIDELRRLKQSGDIYSTLIESSKDGVIVIQDGFILFANNEMVKMTGFSLEESINKPFIDFITPEYRDIVSSNYRKRMAGETVPARYGMAFNTKDGGVIDVEVNASRIEYHGKPADMAIIRDQTEQKRIENLLRERDEFLNSIIEQSPDAIWISDTEGNVVKINKALRENLKVTDDEIIGKYNVLKDTQVLEQGHFDQVKSVFEEGKTVEFTIDYYTEKEKQVNLSEKSHTIIEILMSPLKNSEGKIINVLCQQKDITKRVQAEQALLASEEKYRSLFNYSTDAMIMSAPDGRVLSANPAACRLLGATEQEICEGGRNSVVDVTDPRLKLALAQREKDGYFRGEIRCVRKDGSKFDSELTSAIFKDSEGKLRTWIVIRDITEYKNNENAIRKYNRTLRVLNQCNQALVRSTDEEFLLQEICRIIIEDGGYHFTWVGYKNQDKIKSVKPAAWNGFEKSYLEKADIRWSNTKRGKGPTGTCIRTGEVCVIQDTTVDTSFKPWITEAVKRGYLSIVALPLKSNDVVFGSLTIYADERNAFSQEEITLLTELSNDLSYGILSLQARKARDEAEKVVRENEKKLKSVLQLLKIGSSELDVKTSRLSWDDELFKLFERNTDDGPLGQEAGTGYFTPEQEKLQYKYSQRAINNKEKFEYEMDVYFPNNRIKHFFSMLQPLVDDEGNVSKLFGIIQDITERKKAEESIRLFDAALKSIHDCVLASDNDFRIFYWNETCEKIFGIKSSDATGKYIDDVIKIIEDHPGHNRERVNLLLDRGYDREEQQYQTPSGTIWVDVRAQAIEQDGKRIGWITIATDISEHKQAQKRQQLMVDILHLLNESGKRTDILKNINHLIKQFAGVEAVGIRLKEDDDYPYVSHSGYIDGHVEAENLLCMYENGLLLRDDSGNPILDCMCGNIIRGYYNSEKPYFTSNGSFWTNSISELLPSISKKDRQVWTRKRCTMEGYESAALIPVRSANEIIGLFQLNDRRKNMFTPDMIEFIENVGISIGIAFSRSMAQEELEQEKNRVESIINTAQTIILSLDKEGNILDYNPYMEELSGYKIDEVRGKNWFETFLPDNIKKQIKNVFKTSISGSSTRGNINPIITKEGLERQIVWYDTVIRDEQGNISSLLATGQDITERIQLEELNTVIITKTPIGIYIVQENRLVYMNPEFQKITGYSDDDLKNMGQYDLVHPDDREYVRKESILMLKGQSTTPFEFRVYDRYGKMRWVLETVISITYRGKRAALGCFMDITENKLAGEIVRQSEIKLRTIIEAIPQGIIVTDLKGNILQANLSALKLYGYETDNEIRGKNALDFATEEYYDKILDEITQARESSNQVTFLYSALAANGKTFPAEMSIAFIRDTEGNPTGIIGVFEDISERIKLQEQLVMTDRLASVGELAAGIAHELNNPLTGVVGFSDLLLTRTELADDIKEDLATINREAIRASQVARHLLTFARKHPDEKIPVDINNIIKIVLELRAYEQKVNNIQVITHLDPNLSKVTANDFQLQQVFINIIINAEYFMTQENQKGTLIVTTEQSSSTVCIIFEDDGPGIPPENLVNIFNPFFTTKEVGKGTGLGLSICYGIITEHSGKIHAENRPEKGARFVIELPANKEN